MAEQASEGMTVDDVNSASLVRDALESAQAAIWDKHYGKGIAVAYARKVDAEIRRALAAFAALVEENKRLNNLLIAGRATLDRLEAEKLASYADFTALRTEAEGYKRERDEAREGHRMAFLALTRYDEISYLDSSSDGAVVPVTYSNEDGSCWADGDPVVEIPAPAALEPAP